MKVGDIVKLKDSSVICIVVKQVPNLEKYHDTRFRLKDVNKGRDYEVQTSSKHWEVISESR